MAIRFARGALLATAVTTVLAGAPAVAGARVSDGTYRGKTADGRKAVLQVGGGGRWFQVARFEFRATCDDGHWIENHYYTEKANGRTPIRADGTFSRTIPGEVDAVVKGRFGAGGRVRGTLRLTPFPWKFPARIVPPDGATLTCRTGAIAFTAAR